MKKIIALVLVLSSVLAFAACGESFDPAAKSEGVMTYEEYAAAALDTEVVVETYVQAKQSWWDNKGTFYTQDPSGAYFIYEMACTQEEYDKLTVGTKIKVTGTKAEWSGEVEIIDAKFEILEGTWTATPVDLTAEFGKEDLIKRQNQLFAVKGAKVVASTNADGVESAFLYNWDGSGECGSDVYFNVEIGGATYSFTVESYLTGADTAVYKAAESLQIGDTINVEGFLYWYNGANPHITSITK